MFIHLFDQCVACIIMLPKCISISGTYDKKKENTLNLNYFYSRQRSEQEERLASTNKKQRQFVKTNTGSESEKAHSEAGLLCWSDGGVVMTTVSRKTEASRGRTSWPSLPPCLPAVRRQCSPSNRQTGPSEQLPGGNLGDRQRQEEPQCHFY